jgi:hypothetical protein
MRAHQIGARTVVKVTYLGFKTPGSAEKAFRELKPYRDHLIRLACNFFPMRPDYHAIQKMVEAIDEAARHFGLDPHELYASKDSGGVGSPR